MEKMNGVFKALRELLMLGAIILLLMVGIQIFSPPGPAALVDTPAESSALTNMTTTAEAKLKPKTRATADTNGMVTKPADIVPYPPPETEIPLASPEAASATSTSTPAPFPETPALPSGQAATQHNGDIWLVKPGVQPSKLTEDGDVSLIFEWNRAGTKLLYGRGRTIQPWGESTELWLLDLQTGQSSQMTFTGLVKSASWSPVDDRLAYCEYGNQITIIDLKGLVLDQRDGVLCQYTWSPDGTAIAVESYTPDMVDSDGLAHTVLGVWSLMDDKVQLFSTAKDEVHASPVWSTDGQRILFVRYIHNTYDPEQREQGLYIADVINGEIRLVLASPTQAILGLTRSPQADQVAFRIGTEIYLMDFQGGTKVIGQGHISSYPIWLPDGKTLLQRGEDGKLHILKVDIPARGSVFGGWLPALRQLDYFIQPGGTE